MGDLVLYENQRSMNALSAEKGKFILNSLGPYIITNIYRLGAYKIANMEATLLKEPINSMHLHRYYA